MADVDTALDSNDRVMVVRRDSNGVASPGSVKPSALFESVGLGFSNVGNGVGGSVTQATSITTGVTLNKKCGTITTVSQTVAAAGEADFVVTNSEVAAGDVVVVCIGTHTSAGTFLASVAAVANGQFTVRLTNLHASAAGDNVLVLNFVVIKAQDD